MAVIPQERTNVTKLDNSEMWKPHMSCPHCPSEELDVVEGTYEGGEPFYQVCCLECGAEGPHGSSRKEACKLWDAKHARHRIGERHAMPAIAPAATGAAAGAAAPVFNVPKPPDGAAAMAAVTIEAMATTESPAEVIEKQASKRPFFALAAGLLKPGA